MSILTLTLTQTEEMDFMSKIGLPNTRNIIRKWSIDHLHGIDLTDLNTSPHQRELEKQRQHDLEIVRSEKQRMLNKDISSNEVNPESMQNSNQPSL